MTRQSERRAAEAAVRTGELERAVAGLAPPPSFRAALAGGRAVAVVAEIKRRSPSKGAINEGIVAPARASEYVEGGAAALSILTEPSRFGGSLDDLRAVRDAVGDSAPLLRKDFITHRVQLLEAREAGAAAVLLIARALPPALLAELACEAQALRLDVLVEIRDETELARALDVPGAVIGVNNRDLETLVIEPEVGARMIPLVPRDRVAVYESGVGNVGDVERAAAFGADAVLVGSVLSGAADPVASVRALAAVPRVGR
ncbi:MAG: indole-3-glycerol phosphate synthase TrpC [Gemmatimonadaceae bacterium]